MWVVGLDNVDPNEKTGNRFWGIHSVLYYGERISNEKPYHDKNLALLPGNPVGEGVRTKANCRQRQLTALVLI